MTTPVRNEGLWSSASPAPPADSPWRTAAFWWDHYQIDAFAIDHPEIGRTPGREPDANTLLHEVVHLMWFDFDLPAVRLRSGAGGSALELTTDGVDAELAYHDDAHSMSECLRWSEAEAIAGFLEAERGYPTGPRLALLLLAPFVAVVTAEEEAQASRVLRSELDGLGLLDSAALDLAVGRVSRWRRLPLDWDPTGWVRDDTVGWRLEGTWSAAGLELPIAHSLRHPSNDSFPATEFLRLLRRVGVIDI